VVKDNGAGIPSERLPLVFEPFYTTKDPGQGTGLGLSMVYGFAKQSNGHVAIESQAGRGCTVHLWLPCAKPQDQSDARSAPPHRPTLPASGQGERLLVVEDDAGVRQLLERQLGRLGYAVTTTATAATALALVESAPGFDLLLTDVVLADREMDGLKLAQAARALDPGLRVVYSTGYTEKLAELDGEPLIRKPFALLELASLLREVLER
jgi:CheY-like chemotaxis protein